MTKTALLATLALWAAPQLMIAADAQTARAPAGAYTPTNPRATHVPSAAELAARNKQICQDSYAHAIGDLAYLEARLNLTAAQQPLFDRWKNTKLEIARRDMAACTTREMPRLGGTPPTLLENMSREQDALKRRLADLDAEIPVLGAFYNTLSQAQKDSWDNPGAMMTRRRAFGGGTGTNGGGLAVPPAYVAPAPPYGVTVPLTNDALANPASPPSQTAAATPPPLKHDGNQGFLASVFGSGKPVVAKAHMSGYSKDKDGHFRVTLADGEIWQIRSEGDYEMPQWKAPPTRYVVDIYEGALGSYNMEVSNDPQIYKVRRLN